MTDISQQSLRVVAEEAATWFLTLEDECQVSEADRRQFVGWLQRSPAHVEEFLRVSATHAEISGLPVAELPEVKSLIEEASSNVVAMHAVRPITVGDAAIEESTPNHRRSWRLFGSIAATILVFAIALSVLLRGNPNTYETAFGEQRSILLADGSLVELNTQSRIEVEYSETERLITLSAGEAVFDVTKDLARPFRVRAGLAEVVAIGTRFNVYRQAGKIVVTVVEGRVAVTGAEIDGEVAVKSLLPGAGLGDPGNVVQLAEGNQVAVLISGTLAEVQSVDPMNAIAWTDRRLIFDGDTLATVVREINRYNRRQLIIADSQLAERRISGIFDANSPGTLIAFLEAVGGMRVEPGGNEWVLYAMSEERDSAPR